MRFLRNDKRSFKNNRKIVKNIVFTTSLTLLLIMSAFTTIDKRDLRINTVVIDAGHGGKDSGTLGEAAKEKDIALKIALELGKTIQQNLKDVKVIYTRSTDKFIELEERAQIANKNGADLFISIHCNSLPKETPDSRKQGIYGTETYIMGMHTSDANFDVAKRENAVILMEEGSDEVYEGFDPTSPESYILFSLYQSAYLENSLRLAEKIEYQFGERVQRKSRGVRQAGFWVLYRTSMPSVLVETGYLSNKNEEKYLNDPYGQTLIASGLFRAFRDYKNEIESTIN
ncbi:MAG: N-acetylmuramoyl-L-alanine amidase [Cyclobacteriaceae bacterium]|nr:N-acetylmuramoyl-L-alanine amidase [Cyclobacteriaceae bacterium]